MLQNLHIQNYALIENLNLTLRPGFSVITGETGAGKSIILGALGLLLGQRTDVRAVQPGAKRCIVEAIFNLRDFDVHSFFEHNDLDFDGVECIMRRELSAAGKSRAFINDTPVTASQLKKLGTYLIDIHSQHQNLLLNEEFFQLNLLDTLADDKELLAHYQTLFNMLHTCGTELHNVEEKVEKDKENMDFLQFQLKELDEAQLDEDEQQDLEDEAKVLEHAEEIKQGLFDANSLLSADDEGITAKMNACQRTLENLSQVYPKIQPLCERLGSCSIEIDDIAQDIAKEEEHAHFDPARQNEVNDRLNTIYALEKKHHCDTVAELLGHAEDLRAQLAAIEDSDDTINTLRKEYNRLHKATTEAAGQLTKIRLETVPKVEGEMQQRLQNLGMPHIRFKVSLTQLEALGKTGMDYVKFLFSANKNSPLQDLADMASGGEIARVMLSLKAMQTSKLQLPTIIFDEIDTGVSGRIAEKMALMMMEMSRNGRQVISITHLPQIAARGEFHYKVYKQDTAQATVTDIRELSPEERVTEIAHMLSGSTLTDAAVNNAKELLKQQI